MAIWSDFVDKLKTITNKWSQGVSNLFSDSPLTEAFWEELEEQLIMGDVGIETTVSLLAELRKLSVDRRIANTHELKSVFAELLIDKMMQVPRMGEPLNVSESPSVIMLVGVNGSGKTTTAGKLAAQYKGEGLSVVLAAADTFRAAAIEQLKAWGEKTDVRVIAQNQDSDPAAVVWVA